MKGAILFKHAERALRLQTVGIWSEAFGGNVQLFHNVADTQTLVAADYPAAHFTKFVPAGGKPDDLKVLLKAFERYEEVDLEKDRALLNAIAAKKAERESVPAMTEEDHFWKLRRAGVAREPAELIAFLARNKHKL